VEDPTVRVRARIHLLTTEDGGRSAPLAGGSSYRPNHNFFDADNREMAIGFVELPDHPIPPGETFDAEIIFLNLSDLGVEASPGLVWRIQEGPKLVGSGEMLAVLS
jgi:translation elongation factor EF-Tu-like GTPase